MLDLICQILGLSVEIHKFGLDLQFEKLKIRSLDLLSMMSQQKIFEYDCKL